MRRFIALFALVGVCGVASQSPAAVVLSSTWTYSAVDDGSSTDSANVFTSPLAVASASLPGYSSTTSGTYYTIADSAAISGNFIQSRQGVLASRVEGALIVDFVTDTAAPYSASGAFSGTGGETQLESYLWDNTTNSYLYDAVQVSIGAPGAFILGGANGNALNYFTGSLTGTLTPGHSYLWVGTGLSDARFGADLGAEASGTVSLTIGTIPEASSAMVWSLLGITVGGACWSKRAAWPG